MKYSKYPFYISQLIIKSLKGQLTEAEQEELDRWLTIEANRVLYLSLSRRNLDDKKNLYGQLHPERTWERLKNGEDLCFLWARRFRAVSETFAKDIWATPQRDFINPQKSHASTQKIRTA